MKSFLVFSSLFLSFNTFAGLLTPGTYYGLDQSKDKFTLHLKDQPGRQGSYLGILSRADLSKTQIFLVDEFSTQRYGMSRMIAQENFVLAPVNSSPELVLNVTNNIVSISKNAQNQDNLMNFNSSINFKYTGENHWASLLPGKVGSDSSLLSPLNSDDEASLNSKLPGLVGDYTLREIQKDLFLTMRSSLNSTGISLEENSQLISYFIYKTSWLGCAQLVLVNTTTNNSYPHCVK